jgi:5-oxoprolinase (ATP-hydrolysing)
MTPANRPASGRWQFWIDRGGTFTDVVARRPDGALVTAKLLSEDAAQYADAAVEGMRRLLGLAAHEPITSARVECVKMGTTVATNALLERRGERTLLVTTRGFRDALRIAYQNRPRLFDRKIVLPQMLYERVIEADERMGAQGEVVVPLAGTELRFALQHAFDDGIRACAIVFMHGYRYSAHERQAAQLARALGFTQVAASHEVSPLMKFVSRGDTTVVDAYLSPILRRYVERVRKEMPDVPLYFMQSNGGLTRADRFAGKDAILSGPAGGIVGMARTAEAAGHTKLIGFDMGGTSTDVSHVAGELERVFETEVAGVRVRAPMLSIHTVASGGGSILSFDGARLRVGPESAGADPGPACYRRGGPLCTTDANVMLGRIQPGFFPHVFGPAADQPLDAGIVAQRFEQLTREVGAATGRALGAHALAEGFVQIAVSNMANAVKKISVARGYDVTQYTLQCFGGAGGQHACLLADALGMTRIFVHPLAGVLSAYGMGLADQIVAREAALELPLDAAGFGAARALLDRIGAEASAELAQQGFASSRMQLLERVQLRYEGSDSTLGVAPGEPDAMRAAFELAYRARFALAMPDRRLVMESVSVEAVGPGEPLQERAEPAPRHRPEPLAVVRIYAQGEFRDAALFRRERLARGALIDGPAIVAEANATTVIEPGWQACISELDHMLLTRVVARATQHAAPGARDPMLLEVFNNLFMNIAEQMGLCLQNTAHSVNIKERLDFSCALFDRHGDLIANAPHMPVHLGSMSESIKSVIERDPQMQPGDAYALNDPYHGGTHLPDVTVVTPVFDEAGEHVHFYVASRGHHADIGGTTPGSMPPFSKSIAEEGVLLDNLLLARAGQLREPALRALLEAGPYPARNPEQNIADLRAQIAANAKGARELRRIVDEYGLDTVQAYMRHVQDNAEECVRLAIARLDPGLGGGGRFTLPLDNGSTICVAVRIDRDQRAAVIDFTGTSAQQEDNFNAPRAVTLAAVLYVFRTLVDDDIPLNAGCLVPLSVIVPYGSMLNPAPPAAVVAGNVEVSTCVTNALYGALGVLASSQPTMNNFTFGDAAHQYYETIAGGSGAGVVLGGHATPRSDAHGFAGTSVVQTHMTNSRLTDPEVLEHRFPVRIERFEIRAGSGGAGRFRGGDGAVRAFRFLRAMDASILSNGRTTAAFGLAGGSAGEPGRNYVLRADGTVERLGYIGSVAMNEGDVFVIETPGGGGYGGT